MASAACGFSFCGSNPDFASLIQPVTSSTCYVAGMTMSDVELQKAQWEAEDAELRAAQKAEEAEQAEADAIQAKTKA